MSEKKRPRGRPAGTGNERPKAMMSRRIDGELWESFQAYVESLEPRTSDTAVLEMMMREFLKQKGWRK